MIEQPIPIRLIQSNYDFAVTVSDESMAARLELPAQFNVVIDFTIADQPDGAFHVTQRLLPAFQIDDGQAAVAERGATVAELALAVRSTVRESAQHRPKIGSVR